jgi:hypothetical protein
MQATAPLRQVDSRRATARGTPSLATQRYARVAPHVKPSSSRNGASRSVRDEAGYGCTVASTQRRSASDGDPARRGAEVKSLRPDRTTVAAPSALAQAEAQVAAARNNPAARLALMARVFRGPTGHAPQHLPFRRAALSFMRWQARRGVLNALDASPPGSLWWRAVNERLLRDGCETIALLGGLAGEPSSHAVRLWLEFSARPTGHNWYRAHNASIVDAYLEYQEGAEAESAPERFFMNVALARVLYAHALNAAPRLALGRLAPLGRLAGDPRLGMAGVFLSLRRVLPNRYPLTFDVERYIADEQRLGQMLDYAVIAPRLQPLYEWSADELAEPRMLELVRDGSPIYAWPFEERHVWRSRHMPVAGRVLERVTQPSTQVTYGRRGPGCS